MTEDNENLYITFIQTFCKSGNSVANCNASEKIQIKLTGIKNPAHVLNVVNDAKYKPLELISYYQNTQ